MDWPGAEEISKRLQALLPPQLQSNSGDKIDPQVIQAQQMIEQMSAQMEEMSNELQYLRDERILVIQDKEREWFDSQTKRMEAEAGLLEKTQGLEELIQENLVKMLGQTAPQFGEQELEMEQMEAAASSPPPPSPQPGTQPTAPTGRGPGSMTRKPNIEALTGETKPEEKP